MAIIYDNVTVATVGYSSVDISKAFYSSVEVFSKGASTVLYPGFSLQTDTSRVPPPYDENGYNFNDRAPEKWKDKTVEIDVTSYDAIVFDWSNEGTGSAWGTVVGYYEINSANRTQIFEGANAQNGTITIDTSEMTGTIAIKFLAYAWSESSYQGYTSHTTLNIGDIRG